MALCSQGGSSAAGVVRRSHTPILEGEPVAIVMEFLFESDTGEYSVRPTYPYGKWYFYEQIFGVPTYATFNSYDACLEVTTLARHSVVLQTPNDQGHYWIPEIGLFLEVWHGTWLGITAEWLRW